VKENLLPYLFEAGIDADRITEGNEMTIEMFFQYIRYLADYKKGVHRILYNSV
jgi:hypothetical protein